MPKSKGCNEMSFSKEKVRKSIAEHKSSVKEQDRTDNFKLSFQYLDTTQKFGSTFRDWQKVGLLSKAMETLQGYCCSTLRDGIDGKKFTLYGSFPPTEKTDFSYPKNVPEDAHWARIHINGKSVIIVHIVKDTFYVVFLDKTHHFFLTKRKTGK